MPGADRFSVHNTRIRRRAVNGVSVVEKTIRPNAPLPLSLAELAREMDAYRAALTGAGVPMPAVSERWEDGAGGVVYLCEDGGPNLVERYAAPDPRVPDQADALAEAVSVIRRVVEEGLPLDPHIKNFVGEAGRLRYVDFSPPLTDAYVEARCSAAQGEERRILRENFLRFQPEFLPYHFAGDFLNVDPSAERLFPDLHEMLTESGLLAGVPFADFAAQARAVRAIEDLRLREGVYLI